MLEMSEFFADRNGNATRLQAAGRKIAGFFIQTLGKSSAVAVLLNTQ